MSHPHDSWADVYDLAYERSFGPFYDTLTETTLETISTLTPAPANVVDFGAGTGRLTIPLARMGYDVTAVEPSSAMAKRLKEKADASNLQLHLVNTTMQEFEEKERYDLALCVFTVVLYILDEASLEKAFLKTSKALKTGGTLLLDIPDHQLFQDFVYEEAGFRRKVCINPVGGHVYRYHESLSIDNHGTTTTYEDTFEIRYWPQSTVFEALKTAGFELFDDLSKRFAGTGSSYVTWRKR